MCIRDFWVFGFEAQAIAARNTSHAAKARKITDKRQNASPNTTWKYSLCSWPKNRTDYEMLIPIFFASNHMIIAVNNFVIQ